jgi:hypothetical protein
MKKTTIITKNSQKKNFLVPLAKLFVRPSIVFLSAIVQFGILDFLFFKYDFVFGDIIKKIFFYATTFSVMLLVYASHYAHRYLRNQGSTDCKLSFQNTLMFVYVLYFFILLMLFFSLA